ncbi:5-oxoprolinase subunit PxpB [Serinicoccus kebangsaanensis]|uniref:5-oxoprolinase subunit PxpB n=1 Tax=Serinicoccus kebangsaanensis TaxID=2602069 RepID=UPI001EE25987|nr:5-oxoprolinase subunit PxpB [Serinicoccus kebangsaanensis]
MELDDLPQVLALHAALEQAPPPGVIDLVPAARTLLLQLDPAQTAVDAVAEQVRSVSVRPGAAPVAGRVELPVVYDGSDLAEVAELTGLSTEEVVAAHTGQEWTVAFCGFSPGFGYLVGEDERLHVPRRSTPRTRVPAGAVGLAGEFGGVYPRESPGGWQLIGRTDATLWDVDRDPPALLVPGTQVRFVRQDAS